MKKSKRFLSLLLTVIMVGSLMLSGVSATTVASESEVIYAESFEDVTELGASAPHGTAFHEAYWGGGACEVITVGGKTGSKSIKLTPSKHSKDGIAQANAIGWVTLVVDTTELEVGATYKVSAWFKADKAGSQANILVQANPYTIMNNDQKWTDVGTDWVQKEVEFEMPEGVNGYMKFRFGSGIYTDDENFMLVDDIQVVKTKEASEPDEGGNEEETDPNQVVFESFEDCTDAIPSTWTIWAANGTVAVVPSTEKAQDGSVSIKFTPANQNEQNRAKINYEIPAAVLATMEDGAEYTFSAYYYSNGAKYKGSWEVKDKAYPWGSADFDLTDGQWVKAEYSFVLDKSGLPNGKLILVLGMGWHGAADSVGDLYIDSVSMVKTKEASKPDEGGDEEETNPNVLFAEGFEELPDLAASGTEGAVANESYYGADAYEFAADAKTGSKSIKLTAEKMTSKPSWTQNEYGIGRLTLKLNVSKLEVGATYKASAWFKADKGGTRANINVQANPYTVLNLDPNWSDVGTEWVLKEVVFQMPEGVQDYMLFRFGFSNPVADTTPYLLVDDISIVKTKDAPKPGEEEEIVPSYGIIYEESFETFADANTVITDVYSNSSAANWNGATVAPGWGTYVSSGGSVLLQPAVGTAQDGNVSIKLTPATTSGRMQIIYSMPTADYQELVDGGRYRVTVYYKGEGTNFGAQLEAKAMTNYVVTPFELVDGEWIKGIYDFTLDKSYGRLQLTFGIGYPGGSKGSMYIDNITLERIPWVSGITLNKSETYMEVGETLELTYELKPKGETSDVTFVSSDPSIAEVDANGKITAKKPGTVDIVATAVSGNAAAKCTIYVVEEYVALESISLNKTTLNVNPGWQEKLTVSFNPTNTTEKRIIWTSSDESVVKVDENGNILTMAAGTATITATAAASGKTATCTVTVAEDSGFASASKDIVVDFGMNETVDLSQILSGDYTVIGMPAKGKIELSGSNLKYTAFTWLMEKDGLGFTDAIYTDTVKIAVQSGDKSAIITLNVTINKLEELFYDEDGNWIDDVDLMFSQEYLDAIKAEIKNDPNGERAKVFKYMLSKVDHYVGTTPSPYVYSAPNATAHYDENLRPVADETVNFLMAYLFTKDLPGYEAKNAVYLEKTIEWTKAALEYPYWGMFPESHRNSDLPGGHFLFSTSMVYFWLKDELKNETCTHKMGTDGTLDSIVTNENVPMLDAMEERLWFVCSEMYEHSKTWNTYVMNHLHVRMGGLMAATIALREDATTKQEQELLIKYTGMVMFKDGKGMNGLMPDGTSQEGLPYWEYAAEWLIKAGVMIREVFDIDLFETTHVLEHSGDYVLYNLLPQNSWKSGNSVLNVGDSPTNHWYGPGQILRFIAAEYGDANALWLAQQIEAAGVETGTSQWISVMFTDTEQQPEKPGVDQTLKWFKDMDHVIARSDWSGSEDMLSIKCGVPCGLNLLRLSQSGEFPAGTADAGHAHPDANHITLYANGEFLLRDDGYRRKYAANHNTLLVNGQGQLGEGEDWMQELPYIEQDAIPFIKIADSSAAYDYIVGNATEAYKYDLGLELFERNILWLKEEQVLLVVDNIKTLAQADLELHWFPASKSAGVSGNVYMLKTDKNVMNFYPLTDETTTAFEDILQYTATGTTTTANEKGFRQTYTGNNWQNAVAFSWDDADGEAAFVAYKEGENAGEHQFGVNGKIYTINVTTNEITVAEGDLEVEDDDSASDSTVSTVMMNGVVFDEFDPSVTEYEIDRWWKTAKLDLDAYTNGYGAAVEFDYDNKTPGTITLTCTSKDGTSETVYTFKVTNSQNILGIDSVWTDRPREGYSIDFTYDNILTPTNQDTRIWSNTGLPTVIYDLGKVQMLEDIIVAFNLSAQRDTYYNLHISVDGENWTTLQDDAVVEMTDGIDNPYCDYVTLAENINRPVRYIKFNLRAHSTAGKDSESAYNSIQEVLFTGSDLKEVTVTGGTIADGKDFYEVGDEITVTAQVPEGKKFVRWEVEGVDVDDLTKPTITFTLGKDDVKLVAIFEDVTTGGDSTTGTTGTTGGTTGSNDGSSDTGDNAMLLPAILMAVMALAAVACLSVDKKRRN